MRGSGFRRTGGAWGLALAMILGGTFLLGGCEEESITTDVGEVGEKPEAAGEETAEAPETGRRRRRRRPRPRTSEGRTGSEPRTSTGTREAPKGPEIIASGEAGAPALTGDLAMGHWRLYVKARRAGGKTTNVNTPKSSSSPPLECAVPAEGLEKLKAEKRYSTKELQKALGEAGYLALAEAAAAHIKANPRLCRDFEGIVEVRRADLVKKGGAAESGGEPRVVSRGSDEKPETPEAGDEEPAAPVLTGDLAGSTWKIYIRAKRAGGKTSNVNMPRSSGSPPIACDLPADGLAELKAGRRYNTKALQKALGEDGYLGKKGLVTLPKAELDAVRKNVKGLVAMPAPNS